MNARSEKNEKEKVKQVEVYLCLSYDIGLCADAHQISIGIPLSGTMQ